MESSLSPESRRQSRFQSSEALKIIYNRKREIHRLFEKNLPKIIIKSKNTLNKKDRSFVTLSQNSTNSKITQKKNLELLTAEDLNSIVQRKMHNTSGRLTPYSKISRLTPDPREKTTTPDIFYKALNTILKAPSKSNYKKLRKSRISHLI